ncbi:hypothetical protein [Streptomyces sp. NPDC049881]|uniref:hypothetical protein n=1 Tax=Streptomyces sp. NPDC049881 TaxID=3155778 RepID=UPI003440A810
MSDTEDAGPRPAATTPAEAGTGQWRTTHAIGIQAPDGSRRYELTYEHTASGRTQFTLMGCDAQGVVIADLQADVPRDDLSLIARLLSGFTDPPPAPPPATAPALPAPRAQPAGHTGQPWTERDRDTVRTLHTEGIDAAEIARRLGRTGNSIRWKLWELGLGPRPGADTARPRPEPSTPPAAARPRAYTVEDLRKNHPNSHRRWTPQEDTRLLERAGQGADLTQLMEEFGRNEGAITARLERLTGAPQAFEPPF